MKLTPRSGSLPRSQVIALVLCVANALMAMLPFGTDIQGSALAAVPIASQPRVGGHATRTGEDHFEVGPSPFEIQTSVGGPATEVSLRAGAPTRTSFIASWAPVNGASGYRLDVSTSNAFGSYVQGYQDLDVGNMTGFVIGGLRPGTTYHYRVRAYSPAGTSSDSSVTSTTPLSGIRLIIHAPFRMSNTTNPNAH